MTDAKTAGSDVCSGFEPQNYLRDRCKKCFRLCSNHPITADSAVIIRPKISVTRPSRPNSMVLESAADSLAQAPAAATSADSSQTSSATKSGTPSRKSSFGSISSTPSSSANTTPIKTPAAVKRRPKSIVNSISVEMVGTGGAAAASSGGTANAGPSASLTSSASFGKKERRRSWRDKTGTTTTNCDERVDYDDTTDSISLASYKTANSRGGVSSTKSMESVNSNLDSRSMVTAMSGGSSMDFNELVSADGDGGGGGEPPDDRAVTPTDASEFLHRDRDALQRENVRLQDQVEKLKAERQRWSRPKRSAGGGKGDGSDEAAESLEEKLVESESLLQHYRDESSTLKAELQQLQKESLCREKLKAAEARFEALAVENEELKGNVAELKQELEEMQDQYREEEIDEFRELQRELEQNAKNCRILQFKLRKSERQREQLLTEKNHVAGKLRELQQAADVTAAVVDAHGRTADASSECDAKLALKDVRIRELESELRIAKEVSVRLHNELEAAEDKRYKLEDEVFYYKEKCRELQTQNKWRDARNRADRAAKRQSQELSDSITMAAADEAFATKELRDVLERETDLREQLRFTEEDLRRTQARLADAENENEELLQRLVNLAETGSIRGAAAVGGAVAQKAKVNAQAQLQKSTVLRSASEDLQSTCIEGTTAKRTPQKKAAEETKTEPASPKTPSGFRLSAEVEKDISRLLSTVHDLERRNSELQVQLQKAESTNATLTQAQASTKENRGLAVELRKEQELRKELANELNEYKQLIAKSDNNKLIAMATKVELLSGQLRMAQDRCQALHKRCVKESPAADEKYANTLKTRCDALEQQLCELRAKHTFQPSQSVSNSSGANHLNNNNNGSSAAVNNSTTSAVKQPSADEIEQCCALLASVDAQTSRITKQLEKMEVAHKEERRRSLSKDNYAVVVADLAGVMAELKVLHKVLETHKLCNADLLNNNDTSESISLPTTIEKTSVEHKKKSCRDCATKEETVEAQRQEITFYKKKNKELTNQILQTEDRWSAEMERHSERHREQIGKLDAEIAQLREQVREQTELCESRVLSIGEKDKMLEEAEAKLRQLNAQLADKVKQITEMERDQKTLKEWEIKYKKLESLYEREKKKFDADRTRIKAETAALKKRTDDALAELSRLRDGHQRREIMWNEERVKLEAEIAMLNRRLAEKQDDADVESGSVSASCRNVPIRTVTYRTAAVAAAAAAADHSELQKAQQRAFAAERKNRELEQELQSLRTVRTEIELELNKNRQVWERERDSLTHKKRQDEKVRGVELEALQQKFTSRMNIMETSNKSLHSQLVQARRERDQQREMLSAVERQLADERKIVEVERNKYTILLNKFNQIDKRVAEATELAERRAAELALAVDAHQADWALWEVEKLHWNPEMAAGADDKEKDDRQRLIAANALSAAEKVQRQYAEYQKFHGKEIASLKAKLKVAQAETTKKEHEFQRRAKELTEQIKVLEIDQRNLAQSNEAQRQAGEAARAEQERLREVVRQAEMQRITCRYKLASIIEQLNSLNSHGGCSTYEFNEIIVHNIVNQLTMIKEEDATTTNNVMCCPTAISENLSEADTVAPSDTLSQTSISLRSTPQVGYAAGSGIGSSSVQCSNNNANSNHCCSANNNSNNNFCLYNRCNGGPPTTRRPIPSNGFAPLAQNNRSYSIESSTTWDSRLLDYTARSVSPVKKCIDPSVSSVNGGGALPTNNFILQYDKDGRAHYVKKSMSRSALYDNGAPASVATAMSSSVGGSLCGGRNVMRSAATLAEDDYCTASALIGNDDLTTTAGSLSHVRMNSTGTNVLYKICREELSRGTNPSVRSIARAFENIGKSSPTTSARSIEKAAIGPAPRQKSSSSSQLRGFFSIRKSRSVDAEAKKQQELGGIGPASTRTAFLQLGRQASALSNDDLSASATLPRGGRNPFKGMGSKIVERVRRSLSRSSKRDESVENATNCRGDPSPVTVHRTAVGISGGSSAGSSGSSGDVPVSVMKNLSKAVNEGEVKKPDQPTTTVTSANGPSIQMVTITQSSGHPSLAQ